MSSLLSEPKRPTLEQFDLTDAQVEEFNKRLETAKKKASRFTLGIFWFVGTIIAVSGFVFAFQLGVQGRVLIGLGGLFFFYTFAMIGEWVCEKIENRSAARFYESVMYERIVEYGSAEDTYLVSYQAYENELAEQKKKKAQFWKSLTGLQFEFHLAELYRELGYRAEVSRGGGDGGVYIRLWKDNKFLIVQCKAHKGPVGPHVARDLFGTLIETNANGAILASTSGFTTGVYSYVEGKNIQLLTVNDILSLKEQTLL